MSIIQKVLISCKTRFRVRSYSGRGMSGRECLGVELPEFCRLSQFYSLLVECTIDLEESEVVDLAEEIYCMETDSLGKGMIVYFPDVEYVEHEEDIE